MDVKAAARSKRAQTQRGKSKHGTKHTQHSQEQKKNEPQHTQDNKKNEAHHSQEQKKKEPQNTQDHKKIEAQHSQEHKKNEGQSSHHLQKVSQLQNAKPSLKEVQQGQSSHFQQVSQVHNAKPSKDLPTNWDRYEDPEQGEDVPPQQEDELIKSKGADYAYLISQAQEQSGFDAVMPAYAEGITSMLYVRGQNLLSWGKDDNFIVKDDNASAEYEASFLSLDLHWLASQLAQLECSKRLLIEEDKLPAEVAKSHQLREQQEVHALQNESRAPSQSGKHELGEVQDQIFSNENESAVCNVQSVREYERKELKDTTGQSILSMEQRVSSDCSPKILCQGTVHSHKEASNLYLSSLDSPIKVGSSLYKTDSKKNVEDSSGIEARTFYKSSVKISKESNLVAGNDIRAGVVRFEPAAAEAELDALLDALDTPSNAGMLEVHGTISDRIFPEKSLYKDKQPFQDQLQGPNIISRNSHSLTSDDTLSEKVNRGHQGNTGKNTSGSKSTVATLLAPKSSTYEDAPKVVEDDFDAWLDTI